MGMRVYDLKALAHNKEGLNGEKNAAGGVDDIVLGSNDEELCRCVRFLRGTSNEIGTAHSNFGKPEWRRSDLAFATEDVVYPRLYILRSSPGALFEICFNSPLFYQQI